MEQAPRGRGCSQWTPLLGTGLLQPFEPLPPPPTPSGSDLAEKPGVIPVMRQTATSGSPKASLASLLIPPSFSPWTAAATWPQRPPTSSFFGTPPETQAKCRKQGGSRYHHTKGSPGPDSSPRTPLVALLHTLRCGHVWGCVGL